MSNEYTRSFHQPPGYPEMSAQPIENVTGTAKIMDRRAFSKLFAAAAVGASLPLPAGSAAAAMPAERNRPAAGGTQSPDDIRGLKWRGAQRSPDRGDALTVRFDTQGLSYATAVGSLVRNNFRTVILRVANMTDLPAGTTKDERNDEVIKLLRELNRRRMKVYLWKRQWFQRSGRILNGSAGADDFIADMSVLINRARREGIDTALQGVTPIETNLNDCHELLERTLYVAAGINSSTDGWLRTHTLMMPGAGMGPYFRGIGRGGSEWLTRIGRQTRHFAFIYKHMKSQEGGVCDLEDLNPQWNKNVGWYATTTVAEQIAFLRETMGVADLEAYVRRHRANLPNQTHVVFWGDHGDGVAGLSALTEPQWNYNTLRALHQLLVISNHWRGYFFNFPFTYEGATEQQLWRYLITVDREDGGTRSRNHAMNRSNTQSVWREWHRWPHANF